MNTDGSVKRSSAERLARGLGWFSVGLGLAEILAPKRVSRWMGIGEHPFLLRLLGIREVASGLGILTQHKPASWVWSRVGGDVMDLAVLGASLPFNPGRVAASTAAVAGVTALDVFCGRELGRSGVPTGNGATHFETSLIINRPPKELYEFWHDFRNLPRFLSHIDSVETSGDGRSHWAAKTPAGLKLEWDAEIVNETLNELIAWRSAEGADVDHAGTVRFEKAPGGRGTIVRVKMQYRPMGGRVVSAAARLFGQSPELQIRNDLLRLKQVLEAGEVARTDGQPAGRPKSTSRKYDGLVQH